ncbi:MAG: MBL fold metallo-hydrolase [Bacilli bacterium]
MLKLKIIGTSSSGNEFILDDNVSQLMLDCGINNSINHINVDNLSGIVISHCHLDHCRDCKELSHYIKCHFYGNKTTVDTIPIQDYQKTTIDENKPVKIGNYNVLGFEVYHDMQNYGYLIKHMPSGLKILYIIDTSDISNLHFNNIDIFIIECNHSIEYINNKEMLDYKDYRTISEFGHLPLESCIDFLEKNVNCNTKNIVLTHISRNYEDYKDYEKRIQEIYPKINVIAVDPKLKKPLDITLKEDLDINFD